MLKMTLTKTIGLILFSLSFAFALSACSTPVKPTIELNPQINTSSSSIGAGKSVHLTVIDSRHKTDSSANIDPAQNVSDIFKNELSKGLRAKNFMLNDSTSDNQLTFKLLSMEYRSLSGYVSSNIQTFVSAQMIVQNNRGIFSKTYNASTYNDNYLSPIKQSPSEQVNSAVNKLLNSMMNDRMLLQALSNNP